jgi:hypothetical protein
MLVRMYRSMVHEKDFLFYFKKGHIMHNNVGIYEVKRVYRIYCMCMIVHDSP